MQIHNQIQILNPFGISGLLAPVAHYYINMYEYTYRHYVLLYSPI